MSGYIKIPLVGGSSTADKVGFDNSGTDLTATNVQDAIVEVYNATSATAKYVMSFTTGTWISEGGAYVIKIPVSQHNKGASPQCKTYELLGALYLENVATVLMDSDGNITVEVTQNPDNRFSGKITIQ